MDRLADPRIYQCQLEQSVEPLEYVLDQSKYAHCEKINSVLKPEIEKPISSLEECFATQRARKSHIFKQQ